MRRPILDSRLAKRLAENLRWWAIRRVTRGVDPIMLLGYASGAAGYTDYPTVDAHHAEFWAKGVVPS